MMRPLTRKIADEVNAIRLRLEGETIWHDSMAECVQRIAQLHRLGPEDPNNLATAGRGLALFGPAGCGKSKIIDLYHAQYAPDPAKVLKVRVPQVARAEDLVIKILEELEDRYPADGTHRRRITRSLDAMVERDIGLVLFDEIHHFLAKSSRADVNTRGGHFLKQYLDSIKIPTFVAGTLEAEKLFQSHAELKRRFVCIYYDPFNWSRPASRRQFFGLLEGFARALPFPNAGAVLSQEDIAACIHRNADGVIAYVRMILVQAAEMTLRAGGPTLEPWAVRKAAEAHGQTVTL